MDRRREIRLRQESRIKTKPREFRPRPLPRSDIIAYHETGGRSLRSDHRLPYEPPPAAFAPLTRQRSDDWTIMARTRLTRRYQVTLPLEMRDGLQPGQYVNATRKGSIIILVPERTISAYRGILKGVPTTGFREKTERQF